MALTTSIRIREISALTFRHVTRTRTRITYICSSHKMPVNGKC